MIYVSIPVHEKLEVIANQANNFKRYLPEAKIVFHLSPEAKFSIDEFNAYLRENSIDNALVNPKQVDTAWAKIINAHLENILYIIKLGDAEKIVFHASNDMLVREGLEDYLKDKKYIFHHRLVRPNSYWWPAEVALKDVKLMDWLAIHGGGAIVASQIEGSMYPIEFLKEFADELLIYHSVLDSELYYGREEIFFSSFAVAKGRKSEGLPYIFSEIQRFDKILWSFIDNYSFILNSKYKLSRKLRKEVNQRYFKSGLYKITIKDIEAIRKQDYKYLKSTEYMRDGNNIWQLHNYENLFGVKRVERDLNDPIRKYITG